MGNSSKRKTNDLIFALYVVLAILVGIWAGNKINAPKYVMIDQVKETYPIVYTHSDGLKVQEDMRLAWQSVNVNEKNTYQLVYYNPDNGQTFRASDELDKEMEEKYGRPHYGWWRYFGIWSMIAIGVASFFIILYIGSLIVDYTRSIAVVNSHSMDKCIDFLNSYPVAGKKRVEKEFSKHLNSFVAQKKAKWQKMYNPQFYNFLCRILDYVKANRTLEIPYSLTYSNLVSSRSYSFDAVITKNPEIFNTDVDMLLDNVMTYLLKERVFSFHAVKHNLRAILFAKINFINSENNVTPGSQGKFTGVTVAAEFYTYHMEDKDIKKYMLFAVERMAPRVNYTFKEGEFNAEDLYTNIIEETIKEYTRFIKQKCTK